MEKSDLMILMALRDNARQTLTDISKKTAVPISTIYDRMKSYDSDLVRRYTCLVDFATIGFNTHAMITLKVKREVREELRSFLNTAPNINCLFKINNGYDFLFEAVFRHLKELEDFLERLEEKFPVKEKHVYYIIEDIAREKFMSNPVMHGLIEPKVASSRP
ncbi:MAG: Lrp/AsnC family transcriptional regulator [Nanoarchaeota archaeon]